MKNLSLSRWLANHINLSPHQPTNGSHFAALQITSFRVPAYVPITLGQQQQRPAMPALSDNGAKVFRQTLIDMAKPILFDCDYNYKQDEDLKLTVRWFKNKEPEPFYQWLPELNVRHFADWIRPLVNQSFVSDPLDPLKRYRSILIKRLSMNLTGTYTCSVSSLADQDSKSGSLIVYQPPKQFTFEHKIFPAPAPMISNNHLNSPSASNYYSNQQLGGNLARGQQPINYQPPLVQQQVQPSPTQFKALSGGSVAAIVRPPNNNASSSAPLNQANEANTKIVYTHDGRPIKRTKSKRQADPPPQSAHSSSAASISDWMLRKRLQGGQLPANELEPNHRPIGHHQQQQAQLSAPDELHHFLNNNNRYSIQLHHFQCQAFQVTPRPTMLLQVKRGVDSIAQYLHESSSVSIRPYQVSQADYYYDSAADSLEQIKLAGKDDELSSSAAAGSDGLGDAGGQWPEIRSSSSSSLANETNQRRIDKFTYPPTVTLYDITLTATVALNVSLISSSSPNGLANWPTNQTFSQDTNQQHYSRQQQQIGAINTVLPFRRGQKMSFECQLEITGTEFEQRKRININEEG